MQARTQVKMVVLSGLGGLLEFYDFIIYALLASYLAELFFPLKDVTLSLLATFCTFSVGYLVRPLGGFIFGHFGDKYGRKKCFMLSIFIMAVATFCIGIIPSYQQIGVMAPILLVFFRLLQGISVGGEIPGAITYMSEIVPNKTGVVCGIIFFFLLCGIVLGAVLENSLHALLSPQQLLNFGWRILFFLGGLFGIVSYFLRQSFYESPLFAEQTRLHKMPFYQLLKQHKLPVMIGMLYTAFGAAMITLLFLFTPAYLRKTLHYSLSDIAHLNTLYMTIAGVIIIAVGYVMDKTHKRNYLGLVAILTAVCVFPIFTAYVEHEPLWWPMLLSAILLGCSWGIIPSLLSELFPVAVRYTGIGTSYNLGFAIFGGLSPLIAMSFIAITKQLTSPAWYLVIMSVCCLFAIGLHACYLHKKAP